MGKIALSWTLVMKSLSILASDKELILLPMVSSFLSFLAAAALYGWYFASNWDSIQAARAQGLTGLPYPVLFYLLTFIFYVISYFVVDFCNVALIAVANNRMAGGHWKMRDGLALAWERSGTIFQWAVFAATVGMILRIISERVGFLGRIVTGLVGLTWSLAIYFIVPVLAFDNLGPIDAVKRSAKLFRETWGENVAAGVSFGLIFGVPLFFGVGLLKLRLLPMGFHSIAATIAVVLDLLFLQFTSAVCSAAWSIFNVALYNYALSGAVHGGFSADDFQSAWVPKS